MKLAPLDKIELEIRRIRQACIRAQWTIEEIRETLDKKAEK